MQAPVLWPLLQDSPGKLSLYTGCLTLVEILEISWKFTKSPGNRVAVFDCFVDNGGNCFVFVICNAMAVSVQCIDIQLALLTISYFE